MNSGCHLSRARRERVVARSRARTAIVPVESFRFHDRTVHMDCRFRDATTAEGFDFFSPRRDQRSPYPSPAPTCQLPCLVPVATAGGRPGQDSRTTIQPKKHYKYGPIDRSDQPNDELVSNLKKFSRGRADEASYRSVPPRGKRSPKCSASPTQNQQRLSWGWPLSLERHAGTNHATPAGVK
jgi:hypothetical protein